MKHDEAERRWRRLLELLAPIHDRAAATARRLCRTPADGDDLLQAAVLRAFEKLDGLRDPDRFPAWFWAVLLSVHRNRARRELWRRFLPLDDLPPGGEPAGPDGNRREEERVSAARAAAALARLPAVQREAVVLHEIEGFGVEEIAAMQGVTVSAVKSRLARGRERLRRHYRRLGFERPRSTSAGEGRLAAKGETR